MLRVRTTGVLFDLDDTLLDHRGAARRALEAWCAVLQLPGTVEDWDSRWLALETEYYRRFQARELTNLEQRRARVRNFLPHLDLTSEEDADAAFAEYWQRYQRSWRAFPDAVPAIERALDAGLDVGIITNGDAALQRSKVSATELSPFGLPVFASSELPAAKPDPAAFAAACAMLGVSAERCTMVGDVLETDVLGARAAGLHAVLLDRFGKHDPDPECSKVSSLDEVEFAPASVSKRVGDESE